MQVKDKDYFYPDSIDQSELANVCYLSLNSFFAGSVCFIKSLHAHEHFKLCRHYRVES